MDTLLHNLGGPVTSTGVNSPNLIFFDSVPQTAVEQADRAYSFFVQLYSTPGVGPMYFYGCTVTYSL
jgi:hypothetical protein